MWQQRPGGELARHPPPWAKAVLLASMTAPPARMREVVITIDFIEILPF